MVIVKTNPVGIDALIKKMQDRLNTGLTSLWGSNITIYPRCYRNVKQIDGKLIREIEYCDNNGEYNSLINAEGNKIFFYQSADAEKTDLKNYSTELEIYFTVDLKEVKPDVNHRADEEVHADVLNLLDIFPNTRVSRVITGIENVYRGLEFNVNDDTQPNHCFKVVIDVLRFDINAKC